MDSCVKRYRERRDERLRARGFCDAAPCDDGEKWHKAGEEWTDEEIKAWEEKYGRKPIFM